MMGRTTILVSNIVLENMLHFPEGTEILDIQRRERDDQTFVFTVSGPVVPDAAECLAIWRTQPASIVMTLEPVEEVAA